jgi:DNA-directed RNA polymerase subunit RPC12/RpoP
MKVLRIAAPLPEGDVYRPVFFDQESSVEGELLREEPAADPNAETEVPAGATTVVATVPVLGPSPEPEPPPRIYFACPSCGGRLAASRDLYDRRGRCSRCGSRLLISLVFNPSRRAFEIQLLRLGDAPSGQTRNVPAV